jgi:hypothetical protein
MEVKKSQSITYSCKVKEQRKIRSAHIPLSETYVINSPDPIFKDRYLAPVGNCRQTVGAWEVVP